MGRSRDARRSPPGCAPRLRAPPAAGEAVAEILDRVRAGGDAAVRELAEEFGDPVGERLRVDPAAIAAAPGLLEPGLRESLRLAALNIAAVARAELAVLERAASAELEQGQRVEVRSSPVAVAGVYVPGGRAAYPSSVLMCTIPARVAGVARVVVATPPDLGGKPADAVLAACCDRRARRGVCGRRRAGDRRARLRNREHPGGRGDRRPGQPLRDRGQASGDRAGRRSTASPGPSELVVVADGTADPEWIALDLCAQAEHGDDSPVIVVSPDAALLDAIGTRVEALVAERPSVTDAPLALVTAPGLELALSLADAIAPGAPASSMFAGADESAARGRIAGCVFVGSAGATAFGDYAAGSNHVLPTGGAARFGGSARPGRFHAPKLA